MESPIGWGSWFGVALPVSFISIILIWCLLLLSYHPQRSPDGDGEIEIRGIRPTREKFTVEQWWVSFVCIVTIGLWCVEHSIERWVGDMGVIALIPVLAFFSTGVLKKVCGLSYCTFRLPAYGDFTPQDDFERFAWTIVFLAMGGIALGKGVSSSGLLKILHDIISELVEGYRLYTVVLILSPIVLVCIDPYSCFNKLMHAGPESQVISTFISHTIASVLLVPIAKEVGKNLPGQPQNLLIFVTALICSTGMGMPVSGFPNQTA